MAGDLSWPTVWRDLAARLAAHRAAGRGHLLTEDSLRMETILTLIEHGVAAGDLMVEYQPVE